MRDPKMSPCRQIRGNEGDVWPWGWVQEQLGSSKFMKTYRCKVNGVPVVVKNYVKRDPDEVRARCRPARWLEADFRVVVGAMG